MRFEVNWQYWDGEDKEQVFESKQYLTLSAAKDKFNHMTSVPDIEYIRIAVIIEEYNNDAI